MPQGGKEENNTLPSDYAIAIASAKSCCYRPLAKTEQLLPNPSFYPSNSILKTPHQIIPKNCIFATIWVTQKKEESSKSFRQKLVV